MADSLLLYQHERGSGEKEIGTKICGEDRLWRLIFCHLFLRSQSRAQCGEGDRYNPGAST
jgi:hypothetical protein